MPTTIYLYPFESFDLVRRRWSRARYVCTLDRLGRDGAPFRIIGPPEVREVPDDPFKLTANPNLQGLPSKE